MVTKEEIRMARTANLYDYLLHIHPDEFKREGHWLRMKSNPTICMKKGCGGFKDYATLETGNSVDFLVRHMNYDFVTAVSGLTAWRIPLPRSDPPARSVTFPQRAENDDAVCRYLSGRGITDEIIQRLIVDGLLYQDVHRNAVFRNAAGDFYESRGTWPGKAFHQCGKKTPDCFWSFVPDGIAEKAYICEGAIDAVSLYLIHSLHGIKTSSNAYCGIAGVANQQTIERIQKWLPSVLAVDNDMAGSQCRLRNTEITSLIPQNKDWNEDLIAYQQLI